MGVDRDAYEGPVADVNAASPPAKVAADSNPLVHHTPQQANDDPFHSRHTRSGVRSQQDSSFSLSGKKSFTLTVCVGNIGVFPPNFDM